MGDSRGVSVPLSERNYMQSRIPLPTDNIYKFYALFGLLVMLTTAIMFFIRHEDYNKAAFNRYIPLETLKQKNKLTSDEKLELFLLEQQSKIAKSDQSFEFGIYFLCFIIVGAGMTIYGFYNWHNKIQPRQDELLDLQIRKLKSEIKALDKSL